MKLEPYPQYKYSKDFGVVPSHWRIKRIKNLFNVFNGSTPNPNEENWEGNIVWTTPDDLGKLKGNYIIDSSRRITSKGYQSCGTNLVPKGSIIISSRAPIGHMSIANVDLCTNQGCKSLVPVIEFNSEYFYYLLESNKSNLQSQGQGATFTELSSYNLKSMAIIEPVLEEQNQIAEFLDKKTSEIDLTIEKDTHLIELLKEKRTALINHVVTKGLDPTVRMKDSGAEWIGEIPENWKFAKLKHITNLIIDGTHFTPEYVADGIPFIRVTDIQKDQIDFDKIKFISEMEHKLINARCNPKKGDLLLSKNGTIGIPKVVDWDFDFSIFVSLCLIKLKNIVNVNYLKYFLLSKSIKEQILFRSKTTSVTNLHLDQIKEFHVAFPPIEEQEKIVEYLNREIIKLENLIQKTQNKISLLEEYKKSLIHHVVTGKVDVREVAV